MTITVEKVITDISNRDSNFALALINAYLGDQPLNAALRKEGAYRNHVNDNGILMPLTKASIAEMLKQHEWAEHPVVQAAMKMKAVEPSVDNAIIDAACMFLHALKNGSPGTYLAIWQLYYGGPLKVQGLNTIANFVEMHLDIPGEKISVIGRKAMDKLVAEGRAPSRELFGLEPVYEVRLQFPTAAAAAGFMARWKDSLGDGIAALRNRMAAKLALI